MRKKRLGLLMTVLFMLFMALFAFSFNAPRAYALSNGLAVTPPMGWNDWNKYGCNISDSLIRQQADAMVNNGLKAVGYQYINIDDCWAASSRDSSSNIVPNASKFPNGIKAVADYVHSLGLKLGIYADAGTTTCAGYPGMYGHEQQDANTYASWGIDYIKVDWCNTSGLDPQTQYTKIHNALASTGRAIVFSLCSWGVGSPWLWGSSVGNLWRTTGDIYDNWYSMLGNFDSSSTHASYAGPGGWNDPDMLEVGNGGMSATEDQTHFSLWAISAAPLILGNDMTNMSSATQSILTNAEVIAVDQDSRGVQGTKVSDSNGLQVWSKPLSGTGNVAVVLLNRNTSASNITVNWSTIGISGSASVRDLWSHSNVGSFNGSYTANVAGHGVVMLKISTGGGSTSTPTPTPTNTPTPTPTATSGSSCKVSYVIQNQWPGGFTNSTTITNTGSTAISTWTLKFTFPGSQQITQSWSGSFSQQGNQVTFQNMSYNGSIPPGGSTSLGFNGSWTTSNPNPTSFTLNNAPCSTS